MNLSVLGGIITIGILLSQKEKNLFLIGLLIVVLIIGLYAVNQHYKTKALNK